MYNNTLNNKIWDKNNTLKSDVKVAILNVVEQFEEDLEVPIDIVDVRIVGSNASYNYNEHSDIDVHLVVNTDNFMCDSKIIKLLYNSARTKFNKQYDITIKGLPIEVSIEDLDSNVTSNGVYSIYEDKWIKFPQQIEQPEIDMTKSKSFEKLVNKINSIIEDGNSDEVQKMINDLYIIRKNSIMTDGEYGKGNLLFKEIRNTGLLQELKDILYNKLSRELTLENMIENFDINNALHYVED